MGTLPIVAPTGGLKDTVEAGPDASQLRPRGLNNWNRVPLKASIRVSASRTPWRRDQRVGAL